MQEIKTDAQRAWELHLYGRDTQQIAVELERTSLWVQRALREQRAKYPASVEDTAVKKFIMALAQAGHGAKAIKRRIKQVFNRTMTPAAIIKMGAKDDFPKPKKPVKKTAKCCKNKCSKKVTKKDLRKKLPKAPKAVKSVCVTACGNKKAVKKAVKKLKTQVGSGPKKQPKKCSGRMVVYELPQQVFESWVNHMATIGMHRDTAYRLANMLRNLLLDHGR